MPRITLCLRKRHHHQTSRQDTNSSLWPYSLNFLFGKMWERYKGPPGCLTAYTLYTPGLARVKRSYPPQPGGHRGVFCRSAALATASERASYPSGTTVRSTQLSASRADPIPPDTSYSRDHLTGCFGEGWISIQKPHSEAFWKPSVLVQ